MRQLVVVGGGFAGLWAALAAARELADADADADVAAQVTLLSPDPWLVMRPRLYERDPESLRQDLRPVLEAAGVRFLQGRATDVDPAAGRLLYREDGGTEAALAYDRLVIATGSRLNPPPLPGLRDHGFDIDSLEGALRLDRHLKGLADRPAAPGRDGFVVIGGGFTGLELSLELRDRIAAHHGDAAAEAARIVLVEQSGEVGPDLGPGPRPAILEALRDARVEVELGRRVAEIGPEAARLEDGTEIPAQTVIATTGMVASELWPGLAAERDPYGRIRVAPDLRVPEAPAVFATGDAACAEVDETGKLALMSCQHALRMGRFAGHNAARDLLGLELRPYRQPDYVTCLDLGRAGAVFTTGWDREVQMRGDEAKALKRRINTQVIYPPPPDRATIMEMADVEFRSRR